MITITDAAKDMITEALTRSGKEVLHVGLLTHHCGGKGLELALIMAEEAQRLLTINDIRIDINEEDEAYLNGFTFDSDGKNLKVLPPEDFAPSSCGNCHEDCEGECCKN